MLRHKYSVREGRKEERTARVGVKLQANISTLNASGVRVNVSGLFWEARRGESDGQGWEELIGSLAAGHRLSSRVRVHATEGKGKVGRPEPRRMRTRNERLGRYRGTEARKGRRETEKGRGETGDDDAVAWSRAANYAEWRSRCRARVCVRGVALETGRTASAQHRAEGCVPGLRTLRWRRSQRRTTAACPAQRGHRRGERAHEGREKRAHEIAKGGVQEKRADERREEEQDKEKLKEEGARGLRIISYPRGKVKGMEAAERRAQACVGKRSAFIPYSHQNIWRIPPSRAPYGPNRSPQQRAAHHPQIRCGASQFVADAREEGARVGRTRHPSLPYPFAPLSPSVRSATRRALCGESWRVDEDPVYQGDSMVRAVAGKGGREERREKAKAYPRTRSFARASSLLRLPSMGGSIHLATHVLLGTSSPRPLAARSVSLWSLAQFLSLLSPYYPAATCVRATSWEAAEDEGRGRTGGVVERGFVIGGGVMLWKEKLGNEREKARIGRRTSSCAATHPHMAHAARPTDIQYGGAPTRLKPAHTAPNSHLP
ncbi:hypothetical protein DFH09DRAFT_1422751 [Mycena vulgaris]|nr:hypothetical protein DFH09DRAFT_1422751 [Mycena vulgaris]